MCMYLSSRPRALSRSRSHGRMCHTVKGREGRGAELQRRERLEFYLLLHLRITDLSATLHASNKMAESRTVETSALSSWSSPGPTSQHSPYSARSPARPRCKPRELQSLCGRTSILASVELALQMTSSLSPSLRHEAIVYF